MRRRRVLVWAALALAWALAVSWSLPPGPRPSYDLVLRTIPVSSVMTAMALSAQDDHLFLADQSNRAVSVLDTVNGHVVTTSPVVGSPSYLVVDARDKRVFVTTNGTTSVDVLDARSGAVLTAMQIDQGPGQWDIGPPVLDGRHHHVFVVSTDTATQEGYVSMFDARHGTLLRTTRVGQNPAALAVDEQSARVFVTNLELMSQGVATGPGSVSVLDARSGHLLQTVRVGVSPGTPVIDSATNRVFVANSPAQRTGAVTVLDATIGRLLRTISVGQDFSTPVVDGPHGHVFVGSAGGVFMFDARSGRVLHFAPIAPDATNMSTSVVTIDERRGRAIALTGTSISVLDTRDGRLLHTVTGIAGAATPVNEIGTVALDERTGRVFVTSVGPRYPTGNPKSTGTVSVLDVHSGMLLQTITVGLLPTAVGIDERTGYVFVVNAGCPAPMLPCGRGNPTDVWSWMPAWLRGWLPWLPKPVRPSTTSTVSMLG